MTRLAFFAGLLLALSVATGPALAAGDPEHGKALYAQCAACPSLEAADNTLGPNLKSIVGRKAGAVEEFTYSPPMRRAAVTWTPETLDAFLADPQAVVAGTKMPFAGMASAQDRADLIAYLAQQ
jgi:cytochrome c